MLIASGHVSDNQPAPLPKSRSPWSTHDVFRNARLTERRYFHFHFPKHSTAKDYRVPKVNPNRVLNLYTLIWHRCLPLCVKCRSHRCDEVETFHWLVDSIKRVRLSCYFNFLCEMAGLTFSVRTLTLSLFVFLRQHVDQWQRRADGREYEPTKS